MINGKDIAEETWQVVGVRTRPNGKHEVTLRIAGPPTFCAPSEDSTGDNDCEDRVRTFETASEAVAKWWGARITQVVVLDLTARDP